ncbi:iron chelate uptake ABC transporter family permease subunit [Hutsoniella sourekii]|uniref:iron chelate uptake ABC transporter family permease subunit n=1 Tax=Hutsoniella sourekii TaxID=87650 RepID=UPI000485D0AD|nr:iron chelate uptake ABC transporter family permease subunit [Hutsoniella sourekii]
MTRSKQVNTSFRTRADQLHYWLAFGLFLLLGILAAMGLIFYNNPIVMGSPSFWPVVSRRLIGLLAMFLAAICQSLATLSFQTIADNRLLTPALLGFESIYGLIQTLAVYIFGLSGLASLKTGPAFLAQVLVMVGVCLWLYGSLLTSKRADTQRMLLIGMMLGIGLRSVSQFMQRLIAPAEYDVLQAQLFGSMNHAKAEYFPLAVPCILVTSSLIWIQSRELNILSMGREVAINLGLNYRWSLIKHLIYISILMAVSTALVGSLSFLGFLVSLLTYQVARTFDHRYLLPLSVLVGFLILSGAYFIMNHIFNAQGAVTIIIELGGGLAFLGLVMRRKDIW